MDQLGSGDGPVASGRTGGAAAAFAPGTPGAARRLAAALAATFEKEAEQRRFFLWLAVAFAAGAGLYFAWPWEPSLTILAGLSVLAGALAWRGYMRGGAWRLALVAALVLAGAAAAKLRVISLVGPEIVRPFAADLSGRVVDGEERPERRPRMILDRLAIAGVPPERTPPRIRLSLSPGAALPEIGARIGLRARLMPVPGPAVPGAYDPHRAAFFEAVKGSGFALGPWTLEAPAPEGLRAGLAVRALRKAVVARIRAIAPGEGGAVAAALVVGERGFISEATNEDLRLSGLAHILSISGLHMMLIAGTAFFLVRAGLAAFPRAALTLPIRKWAAAAAILTACLYLALSGGGAATVRAFVMAAILFGAMLFDRPAISMRNLALALFVVVALEPEGVVEPGFQMSFAAVAALIAAWEAWRLRPRRDLADPDALPGLSLLRVAGRALAATALTTLVASLATAPIAAYHFERVATYSLLGNLLAMPLVSLLIMPAALLVLAFAPFGMEAPFVHAMVFGIDRLLAIAHWVAGLGGADIRAPQIGAAALLVVTAGFLWLALWSRPWRLLGIVPILAGLAAAPVLHRPPDLLVTADGRAAALRGEDGLLRIAGTRPDSYVAGQFLEKEAVLPPAGILGGGVACDRLGCIVGGKEGRRLALVRDALAFPEDCARADIVATPLRAPPDCRASLVIDAADLARLGAHSVRIGEGGEVRIRGEWRTAPRPWQRAAWSPPEPKPQASDEDKDEDEADSGEASEPDAAAAAPAAAAPGP